MDIGLSKVFLRRFKRIGSAIDSQDWFRNSVRPSRFAHKGNFGHALISGRVQRKNGAAILAARAALRGGSGLLTLHVPKCGYSAVQTAVPEAMCQVDQHTDVCTDIELI